MALEVGRRLGAIMFTDIVGYSAKASADEGKALKMLEEHSQILRGSFRKFNGRVVKTTGDGFLVDFASAVDAVNCAVDAQRAMSRFNLGKPKDEVVQVRIGIHVGDVVLTGDDVVGDAVNVAARLQPMAPPGGICVSRQVVDQVERKVEWKMIRVGVRELKNISYPVELYEVEANPGDLGRERPAPSQRRIAILPFANLSADPNDRYFADGMTEELISTVSNIGELSVISRTSVMRYKDTVVPVGEIGRELSAGTILEGSVRKAGNKVRVTTQLIDTASDRHIWAKSYDRDLTDIFAIQGDIAGQVAEALRVKLLSNERDAIERKATANLDAYTSYLKGRYQLNLRSKDGLTNAVGLFGEAVRLDPSFALAYTGMADSYSIMVDRSWMPHSEAGPLAMGYAQKAIELDGDLAEAHASLGLVLHQKWDLDRSEKEFRKAISLKPNLAIAHHWLWGLLLDLGRLKEGEEIERRALELDPYSSIVKQGVGISHLYLGRFSDAIGEFEALLKSEPAFESAYFWEGWAWYMAGDTQRAIDLVKVGQSVGKSRVGEVQLAWLLFKAGRGEEAEKVLAEAFEAKDAYFPPTVMAIARFGEGKWDEGFRELDRAYDEHDGLILYFRSWPWLAEYRADPRWVQLEHRLGFEKN